MSPQTPQHPNNSGPMRGRTPRFSPKPLRSGPKTSTRGLKRRSQPSLDAKERFCKNACFPSGNQGFLRVGWPPFVALRPPLRAIWTGVRSRYPWETPPRRHLDSTGNAKVFLGSTLWEALGPRSPSGGLIWGGPMRGVSPLAPLEWPQDVQKRLQDTTPTIFGCKRAILQKCLFS